ncbi:MAG: outer membrane beta-barrel domain-containing protein [Deltaproteobacteria bacterium]|nr:outer membrane beta-barrel domain-containing protein [Deltaproteobacteria bacterium]
MKKRWFGLHGLLVLALLPSRAVGQDEMTFGPDEGSGDAMTFGEGDEGGGDAMTFGEGDEGGGEGGGLAGLMGPSTTSTLAAEPEEALIDTSALPDPDIWAVQQSYMLRDGRFELTPTYGTSMNDPLVTHNAFGLSLGWYITEVLGISASFQWYQGLGAESTDSFHIARSFRLVVPINEYQMGANLHFQYVPIYGKLTIFNKWIFHWDVFVMGGVGMLFTRPIPVVDPEVRTFDFGIRVAANIGIGARVFLTKYVAIFIQYLDYMYMEKLEALDIAESETTDQTDTDCTDGNCWDRSRYNSGTWLGDSKFTNDMMLHVGASIFFPFTFDYEFPK